MTTITDRQRRARLAHRHGLTRRSPSDPPAVVSLTEALVGWHATDPATPFLSARARLDGFSVADLETALYDSGDAVKHLGMRRTLFVQAGAVLPVVQAACTRDIVAKARRQLAADVVKGGVTTDGDGWLRDVGGETLAALAELGSATGAQLSRAVAPLQVKLTYGEGRSWGGEVGVATRVLSILAAEGHIRRGRPAAWTSSQHRWVPVAEPIEWLPADEARAGLVRHYLSAFGPATTDDICWWTGLGRRQVAAALSTIAALEVDAEGVPVWILPDDLDPVPEPDPWVALLPSLDPTTMGWKERHWYLGDHGPRLFDRSGNAGPTIWLDGRIVGGWAQRAGGEVACELFEDVGAEAMAAVEAEADALTAWMGGAVVRPRFPTPTDKALRA